MTVHEHTLDRYIDIAAGTSGGRPRIAGRRIRVQDIAVWHERLGWSADQIAAEYDLTLAEVYAALSYYFDHLAEIDASMAADDILITEMRRAIPSKLRDRLLEP